MRRALLFCAAIVFALACGDNITEPIPDRTPMVNKPLFATTTTEDGLSISTDKDDYQPGDVVHFTGYGWQPGDTLDIVLTDDPLTHDPHTWTVNIGEDGTFHDSTYVVDEGDLDVKFTLVATSRATGRSLTVLFTDSNLSNVALSPDTRAVLRTNDAVYDVNVTIGGNASNCTVTLSLSSALPLPPGATASFSTPNPTTGNASFTRTLTIKTTGAVASGTYPFRVVATRGSNCQGNGDMTTDGTLIVFGPASKLAFVQQPTGAQSTSSITPAIAVQVLDATNHLVQNSAAPITLAIGNNPGSGTLSGTLAQNAVNGVATFSGLSINKVGTGYTLAASSGGLAGATSTAFDITLGPVAQLAFTTQPGAGPSGVAFTNQPVVAVQDAGGNTITTGTGSNASIGLSIAPGTGTAGAVLACTTSNSRTASAGVAAFSGCQINLPGTAYRLRASTNINPGNVNFSVDGAPFNLAVNNQAPVLAAIGNKTIAEESQLAFTATATDENVASLQFSLANPATGTFPTGAAITPAGAFTWTPFEAQGPGIYRVKLVVTDNGSLSDDEEIAITVTEVNKPPVLAAIGNKSVNEGSVLTFTATATDPDLPANALTFSLAGAPSSATIDATTGEFSWTPADDDPTGTPSDPNTFKVVVKDNGTPQMSDDEDITVTVNNVAPSVNVGLDRTGKEGEAVHLAGQFTDPGADSHTWSWEYVQGFHDGATCTITGATTSLTPSITCNDDGVIKVTLTVTDDDTGVGKDDLLLTLSNVAPTATFNAPAEVDEGSAIALSLTSPQDASSQDVAAGFQYAFDCGTGYGAFGSTSTASCPTSDDETRTVKGKIKDKDGGATEYSKAVVVKNVAPIVDAGADQTRNEGQPVQLSGSFTDPGADTHTWAWEYVEGFHAGATCTITNATTSLTPTITCNDDGVVKVTLTVTDDDTGVGKDYLLLTLNNVAPTATFTAPSSVDEGSPIGLSLTNPVDPSTQDVAAGFQYAFDCGAGAGYGAFGTANTVSCPTTDDDIRTVKGKIKDKDGDATEYTAQVEVKNVAPIVDVGDDKTGKEGETIPLKGTFVDPGADSHAWEWKYVEGFNAGATCTITNATTSLTPTIACTDDGVVEVSLRVEDDDKGVGEDALLLHLTNVAPSATALNANSPVNEGSNITLSLAGVTDPSSVDAASLEYAFDCGSGYAAFGGTNSASCPTNDNGTRNVRGKVRDKDGGVSTNYSATVTIDNVAPTATALSTNSPVAEGSDITLTLAGATDVSSVDAASLHFAFDCGSGYGSATSYAAAGTANAASCPTTDNGTRAVKGKVFDKDGGSNEYSANATITNVNPTITSLTAPDGSPLATSIFIAGTLPIKVNFTDPGTGDTHTAQIDCGNGAGTVNVNGGANVPTGFQTSCAFPSIGTDKLITVTVTDDDGGPGTKTHKLTVTYNFSGFFAPVDRPNIYNVSKAGQAIPLKWRLVDANGRGVAGVTGVTVQAYGITCALGSNTDIMEEYAAGSSGLQDLGDGYYQFNWKTPSSYLNTCKSIALTFASGGLGYTEKPGAFFTFKK